MAVIGCTSFRASPATFPSRVRSASNNDSRIPVSPCSVPNSPFFRCLFRRWQRVYGFRCCSIRREKRETPRLLKLAVSGVTELLRFFFTETDRSDNAVYKQREEPSEILLLKFMLKTVSLKIQPLNSKGLNSETNFVLATWKLRTYLKLPWRPIISIEGNTVYNLDDKFKIVRHSESWNVSALEAVSQIFTPSFGKHGD